jgi:hypothetical protein
MVAFNRRHFWRTSLSASAAKPGQVDHAGTILSIPPYPFLEGESINSPIRAPYAQISVGDGTAGLVNEFTAYSWPNF